MSYQNDTVTVWWVDDDHANHTGPREGERKALQRQAGGELRLVAIHPADFEAHASNLGNERTPDLLLIDFRLGMRSHPNKETPLFARDGVSLRGVALGIEGLKDVPAYLVSGVASRRQAGNMDESIDWVLTHTQLTDSLGGAFLLSDARDYRRLGRALDAQRNAAEGAKDDERRLVATVVDLLDVPEESNVVVREVVRHSVGTVLRNESTLDSDEMKLAPSRRRAIARWVRSVLHRVRGPLVDELMAATMLGTTETYFKEVLGPALDLEGAYYGGIFQRTAPMMLWRQALVGRLLKASNGVIVLSSPSTLAQSTAAHFHVPADERAVCRVCGEEWPESVGFDEEDQTVEAAVHWRCSREAQDMDNPVGFDVVRSFSS